MTCKQIRLSGRFAPVLSLNASLHPQHINLCDRFSRSDVYMIKTSRHTSRNVYIDERGRHSTEIRIERKLNNPSVWILFVPLSLKRRSNTKVYNSCKCSQIIYSKSHPWIYLLQFLCFFFNIV